METLLLEQNKYIMWRSIRHLCFQTVFKIDNWDQFNCCIHRKKLNEVKKASNNSELRLVFCKWVTRAQIVDYKSM